MDNSKLNQTELSYESSAGIAKVNLYTGRLLYEKLDASVGLNLDNLSLSHIYNSQFSLPEGMETNMGNKWKLSVQEYLYSNEDNTYTYIDALGMQHKFELLQANEYYDTSGMGLTLNVTTNTITDMLGNKMLFEENKLVRLISAEDERTIVYYYHENKLQSIYNENSQDTRLELVYENELLSKIYVLYKNELQYTMKYFYEDNNLAYVSKQTKEGVEKIETMFNYEEDKLHYAASFLDKQGFRFEYGNLGKVSEVRTGIVNITEETVLVEKPLLYVGDDIYLGEDNYLGETYTVTTYKIEESIETYGNDLISKNIINYVFPKITVTNELGVALTYYVNEEGTTVSVFEQIGSDLKTLNKRLGVLMLSKKSSTIETINTQKSYEINTNNILCNSQEEITINDNYGVQIFLNNEFENVQEYIKDNIKISHYYTCSFYLKTLDIIDNPKVLLTVYEEDDVIHYKEVKFDGKAKDSWQLVNIPIKITDEIKGISLRFEEQNHNIEIADMRLYYTNYNSVLLGATDNFELDEVEQIKYILNDIEYTLLSTDYMTTRDLYLTALSKNQNDSIFSLFYNNGQKRKKINSFQLIGTENYSMEKQYSNDLGYYLTIYSSKNQTENDAKTTTTIKSLSICNKNPLTNANQVTLYFITKSTFPKPDDEEEEITTSTYECYDLKGKLLGYEDEYEVQTLYKYEENNQKITQVIKDKMMSCVLTTTTTLNDNIETITDGNNSIEIEYNAVTGLVENEKENNRKTKKYFYNDYNNNLQAIKFMNNDGEDIRHRIVTSNNKLINLTDDYNKYLYKYHSNGNLQSVKDLKENITRYTNVEHNGYDDQKVIEISNNGYTRNNTYDRYGKLQKMIQFPYTLTITPQTIWESPSGAKTEKMEIKKEIPIEEYTYEYDDNNVLNKFTINKENDKIECEITPSGTKIYSNEDTSPSNEARLLYPGLYGQIYQYGLTYDPNHIISPRLKSSDNIVGYQNVEVDMSSAYEYDDIGRLFAKEMLVSEDNLFGDRKFRKDYTYLPNTCNILECNTKLYKANNGDEFFNYKFIYAYEDGKLASIQNDENVWSYEYNGLNQLKSEKYNNSQLKQFKYHKNGNIEKVLDGNDNILKSWSYDNLDKLTSIKDGTGNDIINLEYDENNNIQYYIKDSIKYKLTWEYGKQLTKIEQCRLSETGEEECYPYVEYQYDILGRRNKKIITDEETNTITRTEYFYDGNKLLYEDIYYPDYTCKRIIYVYDVEGISGFVVVNGTSYNKYYYIKDILGNIIGIADQDEILITYKYDAWGNQEVYYTREADYIYNLNKLNPFRYRGYYYDVETSLFWLSSRYYSPELCRFIQPADVSSLNPSNINGLNLYSYANNNPIGNTYSSIKLRTTINAKQINLHNGFILGNHSYGNNYPDLSFLSTGFSFIENIFSTFAGAVDGYRKIEKLDNIPGLEKASNILMWVGIGLNVSLSTYESFLVNKSQSGPQKWGNFIGDVAYIAASSAITYGVGYLVGMIPYAGPFLAAPVSIFVGTLLDQIWSGEEVLWINGANISIKGKSLEEWFKDLLTEWFGG